MKSILRHDLQIRRALVMVALAGFISLGLAGLALAAPSAIKFEAESGTLANNVAVVNDATASGGGAVQFNQASTSGFVHPGVVYTKAEIDAWSTSSPEYSRLAGTCAGNVNPTSGSCVTRSAPVVFGTVIESAGDIRNDQNEMNLGFKDQSGFAKVQAMLWAADGNNARRDKTITYLSQYRTVTSLERDSVEQRRLVAGWSCTNLAQAAEIINYQDDQFKRFLREVCYPAIDWGTGPNWHASFADSKLAIAAYLGDEELWADAKRYFYERLKQSVYLSQYDGNKANPIHVEDLPTAIKDASGNTIDSSVPARLHTGTGTPRLGSTQSHWAGNSGTSQINSDYTFNTAVGPIVDGMNAERTRDLAHVNMSYAAWVDAARTIRAQGEQLEQHAYERILKGWDYHAQRVLTYHQTGTVTNPGLNSGDGGGGRFAGYFPAKKFFGADTPASVLSMLQVPDVRSYPAAGALHMVGEAFADGQ